MFFNLGGFFGGYYFDAGNPPREDRAGWSFVPTTNFLCVRQIFPPPPFFFHSVRATKARHFVKQRRGMIVLTSVLVLAAVVTFHVDSCAATYSCCTDQRRGTVCTLAGQPSTTDPDTATIGTPTGVALYPPSSILVTGYLDHRLWILHPNGSVRTFAGGGPSGENTGLYQDRDDPLAARFNSPGAVCVDNEGNALLCDNFNHRIRIILRNGSVRTFAGSGETGLEKGGFRDHVDPLQAKFFHPNGIVPVLEGSQHLLIIGGNWDHRIRVIYPNRTVSTLAGSGGIGSLNCRFLDSGDPFTAGFCHPEGLAQDLAGNIIIAEVWGNRIRKLWRDGSGRGVTTVAGRGPTGTSSGSVIDHDIPSKASFFSPICPAIDGSGNVLVSSLYEHRLRIILLNGSVRTLAGSGPTTGLSPTTPGEFVDNVPLLQARFNGPHFFVINRKGNVIVADYKNDRVRMLCVGLRVAVTPSVSLTSVTNPITSTSPSSALGTHTSSASVSSVNTTNSLALSLSSARTPFSPSLFSFSPSLLPLTSPVVNPISRLLSSSEAAQAIVASGAATAALAGLVTATSMGHATRMGSLMRSVECSFASSQLDPPSLVDLPLQWNIDSPNDSLGVHAGSALFTSAMLVVLPLFVCAVVHAILSSYSLAERPVLRSLQRALVSRYCLLSFSFFVPNVMASTVVVVGHGASSDAVAAAALAVVVPLLFGCVAGQRALMLDVDVTPLPSGKFELRNRPSSSAYAETYGGLVDGCRDAMQCTVRVCFVEDVIVSLLLSLLSGVSTCTASCEWVALAMLVVSALHLLYVAFVHPLRSRVESSMNSSLCAVQVVMAALCLAIASGADNSAGVLMMALGIVAVIQNASFFAQAAILGACACVSESRKKHLALCSVDPAGDGRATVSHALLTAPENKELELPLRAVQASL